MQTILIYLCIFFLSLQSYTKHSLKWFQRRQNVYASVKMTRLKLEKYMRSEKVCHVIAKRLTNNNPRALVIVGNTKTPANSPIKGSMHSPNPQLMRAFRVRADVLEINEFRTRYFAAIAEVCTYRLQLIIILSRY